MLSPHIPDERRLEREIDRADFVRRSPEWWGGERGHKEWLHFAAESADLAVVEMLVDAGSDIIGAGDDHHLGVLGWATCFRRVRNDVAEYLLRHGARLNLWSAIALDRADDVHDFITRDPALLGAQMSRNEHHRTPLHHAAAKNRPQMARLLLDLGADAKAKDATGATRCHRGGRAGDPPSSRCCRRPARSSDFIAALSLWRFDCGGDAARRSRASDHWAATPLRCTCRRRRKTKQRCAG